MTETSKIFCCPNADTTFISSDDVAFKIHSMHLTSHSVGFANSQNILDVTEPVHLPERSGVLEILFQFIEPPSEAANYHQPSMIDLDDRLFFEVAEAAEKYIVYGAMNTCLTRMDQMPADYPFEVLNHCTKHGYPDLADQAAEESIKLPLRKAASKITCPDTLRKWLVYYDEWREAGKSAVALFEKKNSRKCRIWANIYTAYLRKLGTDPTAIDTVPKFSLNEFNVECKLKASGCNCKLVQYNKEWPWQEELANIIDEIPSFSGVSIDEVTESEEGEGEE
ncbi:hypothetical protein BDN70DRAFT_997532 [Pholiota conissans]|uniref:BTB domain-containing protein n=1 Tax=Pholiota conissans TaxID=109636 RepID=A0A9P5YQQ4_9AGAR|nr:hypothetical protein BDN70DRAFT_997532 [Pholiota conissans]